MLRQQARGSIARQRLTVDVSAGTHPSYRAGGVLRQPRPRGHYARIHVRVPVLTGTRTPAGQESKSADDTFALFCSTRTIQLPELSRHTASMPYGRSDGGWMNSTPLAVRSA
jgi:hypothetical protein